MKLLKGSSVYTASFDSSWTNWLFELIKLSRCDRTNLKIFIFSVFGVKGQSCTLDHPKTHWFLSTRLQTSTSCCCLGLWCTYLHINIPCLIIFQFIICSAETWRWVFSSSSKLLLTSMNSWIEHVWAVFSPHVQISGHSSFLEFKVQRRFLTAYQKLCSFRVSALELRIHQAVGAALEAGSPDYDDGWGSQLVSSSSSVRVIAAAALRLGTGLCLSVWILVFVCLTSSLAQRLPRPPQNPAERLTSCSTDPRSPDSEPPFSPVCHSSLSVSGTKISYWTSTWDPCIFFCLSNSRSCGSWRIPQL